MPKRRKVQQIYKTNIVDAHLQSWLNLLSFLLFLTWQCVHGVKLLAQRAPAIIATYYAYIMFGQTTRCRMLYSSPLPQILTYVCMYIRTYIGVPMFLTVYTHCYASRVTLSLTQLTNKIITVNLNRQLTTNMSYSRHLRDYLLRDNSSDIFYTVHMLAIILYTFC